MMTPTPTTTNKDPEKKKPEGHDVNWVANQIGWPFPTWVETTLFNHEFRQETEEQTANRLISMFNDLGKKIAGAMVSDAADKRVLKFEFWRYKSKRATKAKPTTLKATLYKHPDYDKVWMLVEAA